MTRGQTLEGKRADEALAPALPALFDGESIRVSALTCALAVCTTSGIVVAASPPGRELLSRCGVHAGRLPRPLPRGLWTVLADNPEAAPVVWHASSGSDTLCLGCSRYGLGDDRVLLLMREIGDSQQDLARRLHKQRLETTGRLVASLAHDLRTPLAAMVFDTESAAQAAMSGDRAEVQGALGRVRAAATRLRQFIDGLLDFARTGTTTARPVSLATIVGRVDGFVRPTLRDREHLLVVDISGEARLVSTNPLSAEQVLTNLVVNASESRTGPMTIRLTATLVTDGLPEHMEESARRRGGVVRVLVADEGPGVAQADRERLFEPFYTTKPGGTGLGLPMAREAMVELGGDIRIEDSPRGCTVSVWFPRPELGLAAT